MGFTDNNVSVEDSKDLNKYIETIQKMSLDSKKILAQIDELNQDITRLLKVLKAVKVLNKDNDLF